VRPPLASAADLYVGSINCWPPPLPHEALQSFSMAVSMAASVNAGSPAGLRGRRATLHQAAQSAKPPQAALMVPPPWVSAAVPVPASPDDDGQFTSARSLLPIPPPVRSAASCLLAIGNQRLAEFPVVALRHYPIRAAVDGKSDAVFLPSVSCLVMHDSSGPAAPSAFQRAVAKVKVGAGPAAARHNLTIDIFIAAGATPKDRLSLNFANTQFMSTADGLVISGKESVCKCIVNSPHHLRFDTNKDSNRGATGARLEKLLQCVHFQVLIADARERDSIGGTRTVAVCIAEATKAESGRQPVEFAADPFGCPEVTTLVASVVVAEGGTVGGGGL
jgi:hypothetical protein